MAYTNASAKTELDVFFFAGTVQWEHPIKGIHGYFLAA